jgi:xanthosine utilization system XapX-like protein
MIEYVVVLVAFLLVSTIFALLLFTVRQQSNRTLNLVASEYP